MGFSLAALISNFITAPFYASLVDIGEDEPGTSRRQQLCHAGRHDANRAEAGAVRAEAAPRRDEVDTALRPEAAETDVIFLPRADGARLIVVRKGVGEGK